MWKKALSITLVLVMATTLMAGVMSTAFAQEEPYTVYFAYHAPKEGNQAALNEVMNELTMRELNMKVELIPIGWDTYNQKYPAMLAAQQPLDISFVFSFSFASFLDAGFIVDASDYVEYTPDIFEVLGDDAQVGYIGDMLVGFPVMNTRAAPSAIFVRKDIFDALGYKESDFNVTTDDYASFGQITEMLGRIKEAYPDMVPFDGHRIFAENSFTWVDAMSDGFGVLENYGQTTTVTNWYESEQIKQFSLLAREWFEKGYTSKDIAVTQELGQGKMKAGNSAAFFASYTANALTSVKSQTGYDCVMIPVSAKMKSTTSVNAVLNCVMQQSKDKVKAFQFLNWCYTSKEFNDLLNWGVPGVDWVVNDDGQADYPEGVTTQTVNYHSDFGFIYPNQFLMTPWAGSPADIWEAYREFDEDAIASKAFGFSFDAVNVANEVAQCSAVLSKYQADIFFGAVDTETGLASLNAELYDAGLQTIMDEKQRQLDAWLAKQ